METPSLPAPGDLEARFIELAFANEKNVALFERLTASDLEGWVLVSGCLFQSVWNGLTDQTPERGIKDYDVFYFDGQDLSWEAEDARIRELNALTSDLGIEVELRNQARVHLWYQEKFGAPYPPLKTALEAIDRFLHTSCAVGIFADQNGGPKVYAPYGLEDVLNMVLRPNTLNPLDGRRREKEARWCEAWPELEVVG